MSDLASVEDRAREHVAAHAGALLEARVNAALLPLISDGEPAFGLDEAYAVAAEIRQRRLAAGERTRGYKIGFTNRGLWDRYGVHAPIWGPVWDSTVEDLVDHRATLSLAPFVQPRLEPEIMFGFGAAPRVGMTETELVSCIEWVSHGFEVVHTHFEGWRFKPADTVADFALHGRLLVGARVAIDEFADPVAQLASLRIKLFCDDELVEQGHAKVVLGGPLSALRIWVDAMLGQAHGWSIEPGDIVTTGTITDAAPLVAGERWHTRTSDPRFAGIAIETLL